MERRHFLQLSGISLTGLLCWPAIGEAAAHRAALQLPQAVLVQLADGTHPLTTSDHKTWTYQDVTVRLSYRQHELQVAVQSPTQALREVQLRWPYTTAAGATVCGDQWERTYGNVSFEAPQAARRLPWYFIQHDGDATICFGVKTGCAAFCSWQVGGGNMQLNLDTSSGGVGVQLGGRTLAAATIITTQNEKKENAFATARRFCAMMCEHPRLPKQPVYGINDWYFAYGRNSSDLIMEHTALLADLAPTGDNRPFSVIDSGWAAYSPLLPDDCCWQDDFSRPNQKFGDMSTLANNIRKLGMRPGLWMRPLSASHTTKANLLLPSIAGRNDPKQPVLDPSIPENLAHIQSVLRTHVQWGYDMVKHDFSTYDILGRWGFQMTDGLTVPGWRLYDNSRTTAEVILTLYQAIREAAGSMYLIGCNTVSHLSAGLFELYRTGDDTSGTEWDRTRKMGVNTLGFRLVQHNTFYAADGDCVGLTPKVPWVKNEQWLRLLAQSSAPLFISAQREAVGEAQRQAIKASFAAAARPQPVAEPLDWLTNQWPAKWRLDGVPTTFDWS
jgi:alpha-galactosidase